MSYIHKSSQNLLKINASIPNGSSNAVLMEAEPCRKGDSPLVIDVKVTSGTGTLKLQDSSDGFVTAVTKKTVAITGPGTFSITLLANLAGDQTHYPLRNSVRAVVDTTADLVVESVRLMVEQ